jgi:hypothetical protein
MYITECSHAEKQQGLQVDRGGGVALTDDAVVLLALNRVTWSKEI